MAQYLPLLCRSLFSMHSRVTVTSTLSLYISHGVTEVSWYEVLQAWILFWYLKQPYQVLANFGILGALIVGRGFQHLLFGSLRATEVEASVLNLSDGVYTGLMIS
jgi:hypothetical protein